MRSILTPWLIAATTTLLPAVGAAQEQVKQYPQCTRVPSDSDVSAAKGAFRAGEVSFNEADYERAIFYWEDAYRRDCTAHLLLWNLGRAYESQGNKRQAVVALETYVERKPDAPQRDTVLRRIEVLKGQIEREAAETQTSNEVTTPTTAQDQQTSTTIDTGPIEPSGQEASPFPHKPVAIGIMSAGGALAIIGGIVFLNADSELADFDDKCPDRSTCNLPSNEIEDANAARERATLGGAMLGIGLAAVAGGLIYYLAAPKKSEERMAVRRRSPARAQFISELTPALGQGFAGLQFRGNF